MFKVGHKHSEETKRKIREARAKQSPPRPKGFTMSEEHKKKISESNKLSRLGKSAYWNKGEKSNLWKGGVTKKHLAIRASLEYRNWRRAVFDRDDYTCQWCNVRGGKLNADHIKRFSDYPELRFELSNGRTLCEECHKKTETIGRYPKKELVCL